MQNGGFINAFCDMQNLLNDYDNIGGPKVQAEPKKESAPVKKPALPKTGTIAKTKVAPIGKTPVLAKKAPVTTQKKSVAFTKTAVKKPVVTKK